MSTRHLEDVLESERADEVLLRPDRELRAKEHRKIRHRASQELHTLGDPEADVFARPRFDHPPKLKKKKGGFKRHWKTKAWKRRTVERRRRNLERRRLWDEME